MDRDLLFEKMLEGPMENLCDKFSAETIAGWKACADEYFIRGAFLESSELVNVIVVLARDVIDCDGSVEPKVIEAAPEIAKKGVIYAQAEFCLRIIFDSAKKEGRGKDVIIAAYKAFYHDEYKHLKKFKKLSWDELLSLCLLGPIEKGDIDRYAMTRYVIMAQFLDIQLAPDIIAYYMFCEDMMETDEFIGRLGEVEPTIFRSGEVAPDLEVKLFLTEEAEDSFDAMCEIISTALGGFNLPEFFVEHAIETRMGFEPSVYEMLPAAVNMLCDADYKEDLITPRNVGYTAAVLHFAAVFANTVKGGYDNFLQMSGLLDSSELLGKTRYSIPPIRPAAAAPKIAKDREILAEKISDNKAEMLSEMAELKQRLKMAQEREKSVRDELKHAKDEIESCRRQMEDYDTLRAELASLKEYVYSFEKGEQEEKTEVSFDEMREYLKDRKVVVIGGNPNWTKKVKVMFPAWEMVPASASGATSISFADAQMVYFFTDTISHVAFTPFVKKCRLERRRFGYLHGVNIESNVAKIYQDLTAAEAKR